jgi:hypothetical protein
MFWPKERCAKVSMAHEVTDLRLAARLAPLGKENGGGAHDLAVARSGTSKMPAVQHMQIALTKMNIQSANVISNIMGVSGQTIIAEILKGERNPWKLADLKHEMLKASRQEVARSLAGNWRADLLFELRQAVDSYDFGHPQMRECDRKSESFLVARTTDPAYNSRGRCDST